MAISGVQNNSLVLNEVFQVQFILKSLKNVKEKI